MIGRQRGAPDRQRLAEPRLGGGRPGGGVDRLLENASLTSPAVPSVWAVRSPASARRASSRSAAYSAENAVDAAEALPALHASSCLVISPRGNCCDATCPSAMARPW